MITNFLTLSFNKSQNANLDCTFTVPNDTVVYYFICTQLTNLHFLACQQNVLIIGVAKWNICIALLSCHLSLVLYWPQYITHKDDIIVLESQEYLPM